MSTPTDYQRVGNVGTTPADYDWQSFPLYVRFDGTDDFLQSSTITPGAVDKAQVFAGVRKLKPEGAGMIAEFGTAFNTVGSLYLYDPSTVTPAAPGAYEFAGYRNAQIRRVLTTYAAPISNVVAGLYDFGQSTASDELLTRVNGASVTGTFTGGANTGDFGSNTLYVGRRGGTTLPANMQLYSLILRFSAANLDAATITATETWVNGKTKAF